MRSHSSLAGFVVLGLLALASSRLEATINVVTSTEDLAAIGRARHQARVVFVEHDLEHRVRHWATDIDLRPGFAAVAATQQDAEIAVKPRR